MMRDRDKTSQKILQAVGRLLARAGFAGIGVNALAREAGIDKVLIYRYFGGLPELLRAFAEKGDFWPTIGQLLQRPLADFHSLAEMGEALLKGHLRELRRRPVTQEIMRWELHERNELTEELARYRERQGIEIMDLLPKTPGPRGAAFDYAAMAALIHAGLTYLVLRSKTADVYMGVDLTDEAGWRRLENAISGLLALLEKAG